MVTIYSQAYALNFDTFNLVTAFDVRNLRERNNREYKDCITAEKLSADNPCNIFYQRAEKSAWLQSSSCFALNSTLNKLESAFWDDIPRSDIYLLEKTVELWNRIAKSNKWVSADNPLCIAHRKCERCPINVYSYRGCNFPAMDDYFIQPTEANAKKVADLATFFVLLVNYLIPYMINLPLNNQ